MNKTNKYGDVLNSYEDTLFETAKKEIGELPKPWDYTDKEDFGRAIIDFYQAWCEFFHFRIGRQKNDKN